MAEFSEFNRELAKIRAEPRSITPRLMPEVVAWGKSNGDHSPESVFLSLIGAALASIDDL